MKRREFLMSGMALLGTASVPLHATRNQPAHSRNRLLVLVEMQGGNDGLNTVVPFADPLYYALRPQLHVPRSQVLALNEHTGLHAALAPMLPLWQAGELAVVQGVGYVHAAPNPSHFRAAEIWETASDASQYWRDSWLARAAAMPGRADVGVDVLRLTLHGFDTHHHQATRHARLLAQLAQEFSALRSTLDASGQWAHTLLLAYSEFGRSARENAQGGTEHGAASALFIAGGQVRGGLYGSPPALHQLDDDGALRVNVDLRRIYATLLDRWLGVDAHAVLQQRFEPLAFLTSSCV
jgi:uncharacterized protein (DUF1501 family)